MWRDSISSLQPHPLCPRGERCSSRHYLLSAATTAYATATTSSVRTSVDIVPPLRAASHYGWRERVPEERNVRSTVLSRGPLAPISKSSASRRCIVPNPDRPKRRYSADASASSPKARRSSLGMLRRSITFPLRPGGKGLSPHPIPIWASGCVDLRPSRAAS
jgi:hypothetical protein